MDDADEEDEVLLCSECFAELGDGSCVDHPDDPPLDPAKPEVQDMLADMDAQALIRLQRKFMGIGAIPGIVTFFALSGFFGLTDLALPRHTLAGAVTVVGTMFGRRWANRRFRPRFARWTGHDYEIGEDIEGLLHASRERRRP
jgi:hypothetical protein